jgi:hypothetical protein
MLWLLLTHFVHDHLTTVLTQWTLPVRCSDRQSAHREGHGRVTSKSNDAYAT